jgi:hypothetical protein
MQLYASAASVRAKVVHQYSVSLEIEAGCMKAMRDGGQPITVFRSKIADETATTVTFREDTIVPSRVAHESGADAVIIGMASLTPRERRVEKLHLDVHDGLGAVTAVADYSNSDGAEPFEAGETACRELLRSMGGGRAVAVAQRPESLLIAGGAAPLRAGCGRGVLEAGKRLVPGERALAGPGSQWNRLAKQSGADGFIVNDFSYPIDNEEHILIAVAWLLDQNGVVLEHRIFRAGTLPGKPDEVGRQLCRELLTR